MLFCRPLGWGTGSCLGSALLFSCEDLGPENSFPHGPFRNHSMSLVLGKIRIDELQKFLSQQECRWRADGDFDFQAKLPHGGPFTTEELTDALSNYAEIGGTREPAHLYLFGDQEGPNEIDQAREVDADSVTEFVIRCVIRGAKDFLWIACTPEEVSNESYITLMRVEEESEVE